MHIAHEADLFFRNKGLREHLLAASASGSGPAPYPPSTAPPGDIPYQPSNSASPHDRYDPSTGEPPYDMSGDGAGEDGLSPDARKGKRELSTSKRAAQNRAAQVRTSLLMRYIYCNTQLIT